MKISSAEYVSSFPSIRGCNLPVLPTVAFIGRSNVGKSSLINHLLNRRKLVKTSATPGKTQLLNFFLINKQFYFVDLPGYGFASVPIDVKKNWLTMIREFLWSCSELRLVVQLLDIRHPPSGDDAQFRELLAEGNLPFITIANKADKLKKNRQKTALTDIQQALSLQDAPLLHSALNKTGKEAIWARIEHALKED